VGVIQPEQLLIDGVVYEFIARPCVGEPYTTPIGLRWGKPPRIRVYNTTRLYSMLAEHETLDMILYAPAHPEDYALSITHELDAMKWDGCMPPRPYIVLYRCRARVDRYGDEYLEAACDGTMTPGIPMPYTRLYGSIVEALIIASKAGVGVIGDDAAVGCLRCSLWAALRAGGKKALALRELLQAALERLWRSRSVMDLLQEYSRAGNEPSALARGREGYGGSR
jgi:hypothetical protein